MIGYEKQIALKSINQLNCLCLISFWLRIWKKLPLYDVKRLYYFISLLLLLWVEFQFLNLSSPEFVTYQLYKMSRRIVKTWVSFRNWLSLTFLFLFYFILFIHLFIYLLIFLQFFYKNLGAEFFTGINSK